MKNYTEEIMLFYPNKYVNKIEEITIELLQKNKIKALIQQKSLRSERAGRRDKHHTAIHINTMKV